MRKSFDGISGLVRNELGRDPLNGDVYVCLNRSGSLVKLLHWESGGFVLYYKRLEQGTFTRPVIKEGARAIRWPELVLMLEGIEVQKYVQKQRFNLGKGIIF